jgi:hypothetical protein
MSDLGVKPTSEIGAVTSAFDPIAEVAAGLTWEGRPPSSVLSGVRRRLATVRPSEKRALGFYTKGANALALHGGREQSEKRKSDDGSGSGTSLRR